MILFGDYHTHTTYSHGKNSILENALVAQKKGLLELAITEHGFGHIAYGTKRKELPEMRKEIEEAKAKTGINVFLGIESNLISQQGDVDLRADDLDKLDIIICGFHAFVFAKNPIEQFSFITRNIISDIWRPSRTRIEKNTDAYLRALDRYPIDIISHLNAADCTTNTIKVARAARDAGTYIELNGKRIVFTEDEILEMAAEGVKFIINSDAHSCEKVGENNEAFNLVTKLNIPHSLIANLDKIPEFKKRIR